MSFSNLVDSSFRLFSQAYQRPVSLSRSFAHLNIISLIMTAWVLPMKSLEPVASVLGPVRVSRAHGEKPSDLTYMLGLERYNRHNDELEQHMRRACPSRISCPEASLWPTSSCSLFGSESPDWQEALQDHITSRFTPSPSPELSSAAPEAQLSTVSVEPVQENLPPVNPDNAPESAAELYAAHFAQSSTDSSDEVINLPELETVRQWAQLYGLLPPPVPIADLVEMSTDVNDPATLLGLYVHPDDEPVALDDGFPPAEPVPEHAGEQCWAEQQGHVDEAAEQREIRCELRSEHDSEFDLEEGSEYQTGSRRGSATGGEDVITVGSTSPSPPRQSLHNSVRTFGGKTPAFPPSITDSTILVGATMAPSAYQLDDFDDESSFSGSDESSGSYSPEPVNNTQRSSQPTKNKKCNTNNKIAKPVKKQANPSSWSDAENEAAIDIMRSVAVHPKFMGKETRFEEVARLLSLAPYNSSKRAGTAIKNQWNRYLRAKSGFEDRSTKKRTQGLVTSSLSGTTTTVKPKPSTATNKVQKPKPKPKQRTSPVPARMQSLVDAVAQAVEESNAVQTTEQQPSNVQSTLPASRFVDFGDEESEEEYVGHDAQEEDEEFGDVVQSKEVDAQTGAPAETDEEIARRLQANEYRTFRPSRR